MDFEGSEAFLDSFSRIGMDELMVSDCPVVEFANYFSSFFSTLD